MDSVQLNCLNLCLIQKEKGHDIGCLAFSPVFNFTNSDSYFFCFLWKQSRINDWEDFSKHICNPNGSTVV